VEKKIARVLRKIRDAPGLSEDEKHLFARQSRRQSGRKMAAARNLSPLARLVHTLQQKKIRFLIAGMSAAILQGSQLQLSIPTYGLGCQSASTCAC